MEKLVRFRADPKKIRVSIRNHDGMYGATVTCRASGETVSSSYLEKPEKAIMVALRKAAKKNWEGIDLNMEWSYDHPWK